MIGLNGWMSANIKKGDPSNFTTPYRLEFNLSKPVEPMFFCEAAEYTAYLIHSRFSNLHVLLSGGMDSEYIAKTLLKCRIPFTPVIVVLPEAEGENWYAFKFCEENSISPMVLDYSNEKDFNELAKLWVKKSAELKVPPVLSLLMNCIIEKDLHNTASVINGYGEPFFTESDYRIKSGERFEMCYHQHYMELEFGDTHPGSFFTYTPELFMACFHSVDTSVQSQLYKAKLYDVLPRSKVFIDFTRFVTDSVVKYTINKLQSPLKNAHENLFLEMKKDEWLSLLTFNPNVQQPT